MKKVFDFEVDDLGSMMAAQFMDERGHIHKTREGEDMPLYAMADSHLLNTIRMMAQKVGATGHGLSRPKSLMDSIMGEESQDEARLRELKGRISHGYPLIGRLLLEASRRPGIFDEALEAVKPFTSLITLLTGTAHDAQIEWTGEAVPE